MKIARRRLSNRPWVSSRQESPKPKLKEGRSSTALFMYVEVNPRLQEINGEIPSLSGDFAIQPFAPRQLLKTLGEPPMQTADPAVLANAAMPNVMWRLQGIQTPVYRTETSESGFTHEIIDHFELITPGIQSEQEFEETARDIAAFLEYVGEPAKLKRKSVGVWVILFLVLFTFIAYLLKVEYWRDVH